MPASPLLILLYIIFLVNVSPSVLDTTSWTVLIRLLLTLSSFKLSKLFFQGQDLFILILWINFELFYLHCLIQDLWVWFIFQFIRDFAFILFFLNQLSQGCVIMLQTSCLFLIFLNFWLVFLDKALKLLTLLAYEVRAWDIILLILQVRCHSRRLSLELWYGRMAQGIIASLGPWRCLLTWWS